jgi:UDP-GlcNAc3NAcA epimerase
MLKILTIIGARPQIIKAAAISRAIKNTFRQQIKEIIVHTGQHYDENMSQVFFDELEIPRPDFMLDLKGKTPDEQIADMVIHIEAILAAQQPEAVLIYGDTNSTYAGAMAAEKGNFPLIHIEAGLRSWNNDMPEERNRVYADKVSTLLFSPTKTGFTNLINEGFQVNNLPPYSATNPKIYLCGDIMYDNSMYFSKVAENKTTVLEKYELKKEKFILATIHRNTNTDNPKNLNALFEAFLEIAQAKDLKIILPLHPRTRKMCQEFLSDKLKRELGSCANLLITNPVSFLEMIALEKNCALVLTDSGGVQKEAFYFQKPCVVLRNETEWKELVDCGAAILASADYPSKIISSTLTMLQQPPKNFPDFFGDGMAAEFICSEIIKNISKS